MVRAMYRNTWIVAVVAAGCNGGGDDDGAGAEPVETYACLHIAEGSLLDFSQDRAAAESITVGREPWRVNVIQNEVGYVAFETSGAADLVLLLDFVRAVPAVWNDDERIELDPGEPNPNCDEDLPEVLYFSVPGGSHWLEIGPIYQGNVWMMLEEGVSG